MRFVIVLLLASSLVCGAAFARGDAPVAVPGMQREPPAVASSALPREARETLERIRRGGPFPYERDGVVFGNFEKRLPVRARGYYREYTVPTPGLKHRGARRIVAGRGGEYYYTDDHYRSFRLIQP